MFTLCGSLVAQEKVFVIDKLEFKEIDRWYAGYIKRSLEQAQQANASLIILELDTPGGTLSDALNIKNMLLDSEIPVAVFINKNAISAGALIALSAKHIYMASGGLIGAATPVTISGGEMKKTDEKIVSAMRAAIRSAAEANGRSTSVAEAMVDETIVLTESEDGIELDEETLLTLTTEEAFEIGIADAVTNNISEILKLLKLENAEVVNIRENKFDIITRFMLNPVLLSIILSLGMFCIYLEIRTPGFAIPGAMAIICFGIYFIAQSSVSGFRWLSLSIFLLGLLLIILEIFVIPGFGIAGIFGILAVVAGLILAFDIGSLRTAFAVVCSSMVTVTVLIIASFFLLPKTLLFSRVALAEDTANYHSSASYEHLLGKITKTVTPFSTSGIIEIEGKRYDAVSEGSFIDKDIEVEVVHVSGNKIVVREYKTL